jgi:putative peptidoglycan lipid II flippase
MAGHLLKKGFIVSAMTLISRVLGLLREVLVANVLGAGMAADVFLMVQKIPNFLRRLFAEGAFSQAFIPVLAEYHNQDNREKVLDLLNKVAGTLGLIVLVVTALAMLGSPLVMTLYTPEWRDEPAKFALATELLRITFPYLFFITLTGLAGSVLNSVGRFAVPAVTPTLLSICLIGGALITADQMEAQARTMAWAIFIAGFAQLLVQLPFLWKEGLLPRPSWGWSHPGVKKILKLMLPAMFGVSAGQLGLMLDGVFLSMLEEGSVSWLYFADRLMEFPLGLFGIATATVVLPSLSRYAAANDDVNFNKTIDWGLRFQLLIGLPAAAGLIVLADGLVFTVFQHGKFTAADALRTSSALIAYTGGLLSFMLVKVLATGFYSKQDMRTPVRIGLITLAVNMVGNLILMWPLGAVGLALSSSISGTVNAALLFIMLRRRRHYSPESGWVRWSAQLGFATAVMSVVIYSVSPNTDAWASATVMTRIAWTSGLVILGGAIYVAALLLVGVRLRHVKGH